MTETTDAVPVTMPRIGDAAPAFTAETTQGPINFPTDYAGSCGVAKDRMDGSESGVTCIDWFFCTTDSPAESSTRSLAAEVGWA